MKTEELLLEGGELVGKAIAMPVPPSSAGPWRTKSRCSSFRARNISTYQTPDPINEFLMKVSITAAHGDGVDTNKIRSADSPLTVGQRTPMSPRLRKSPRKRSSTVCGTLSSNNSVVWTGSSADQSEVSDHHADQLDDSDKSHEVIPGVRRSAPAFYTRGTNLVKRRSIRESINLRKQQRHCGIDIQSPLHKELIITAAAEPPTAISGSARRNKGRRSRNKRTITSPTPHKKHDEGVGHPPSPHGLRHGEDTKPPPSAVLFVPSGGGVVDAERREIRDRLENSQKYVSAWIDYHRYLGLMSISLNQEETGDAQLEVPQTEQEQPEVKLTEISAEEENNKISEKEIEEPSDNLNTKEQAVTFQVKPGENNEPLTEVGELTHPQNSEMYHNSRRMDLKLGQNFLENQSKLSHSVIAPKLRHRALMKNAALHGGAGDNAASQEAMLGYGLQMASELVGEEGGVYIPQHVGNTTSSMNSHSRRDKSTATSYDYFLTKYNQDQREQANRRERLLTTATVQSNFSNHLRDSIRPMKYIVTHTGVNPVLATTRVSQGHPGVIELRPENMKWNIPSLRMENEESSFTIFVRMNKASAQRLRRSRLYSQAYQGMGV